LIKFKEINIKSTADSVIARKISEEFAEILGFTREKSEKIKLIVAELANNLINHKAINGIMRFSINAFNCKKILNISSLDWGPGIKDIENAIAGKLKSETGLGKGLASIFRLSDYVSVVSNNPLINNSGTIITSCFLCDKNNSFSNNLDIDYFYISRPWNSYHDSGDVISINHDARFLRIALTDLPGLSPENEKYKKNLEKTIDEIPLFWGIEKLVESLPDINIPITAFKFDFLNKEIEFFQKGEVSSVFLGDDIKKQILVEKKGYYNILLKKIPIESDFTFIMYSDGQKEPDFSIINENCIMKKNNGFIQNSLDIFMMSNILFNPKRTNEDTTLMVIKWKKK